MYRGNSSISTMISGVRSRKRFELMTSISVVQSLCIAHTTNIISIINKSIRNILVTKLILIGNFLVFKYRKRYFSIAHSFSKKTIGSVWVDLWVCGLVFFTAVLCDCLLL